MDAETRASTNYRLLVAGKRFLDAFIEWELDTHLDFGGGVKVEFSSTTNLTSEEANEALRLVNDPMFSQQVNDELREVLKQITHRLASRGFVEVTD